MEHNDQPSPSMSDTVTNSCSVTDIEDILESGEIQTYFQPLVSVIDRGVLGFEAYARGLISNRNALVKPQVLFDTCHSLDTQLKIDRICRQSALEKFRNIYANHKSILLFLNINAEALKSELTERGTLGKMVEELGYQPRHVVIEMQSSRITIEDHGTFLEHYRKEGFCFCMDDFQATDLEKLHLVRPDFVKLGRESFLKLKTQPYQKELLASLRRFAADLGCRVVAKGVETEEEAFSLLDNEIHLQQGFFFTKKKEDTGQNASQIFQEKIQELFAHYTERLTRGIKAKKALFEGYNQSLARMQARFENVPTRQYGEACRSAMNSCPEALAVFVLDEHGREIGDKLIRKRSSEGKTVLRELHSAQEHSIQDYFMHLQMGFERFVTKPFISTIDKQRHYLISRRFFNIEGRSLVLCVEFPATELSHE